MIFTDTSTQQRQSQIKRIALVFPRMEGAAEPIQATWEHLGLGFLAAVLRQHKYEVIIINAETEQLKPEQVFKRIMEFHPSFAGFSPVSLSVNYMLEIVNRLKESDPQIKIVLGGHLATMCGKEILQNEPNIDFVLKGDAEYSILELLQAYSKIDRDLSNVQGLVYRKDGYRITENPYTPGNVDLTHIPRCERDDLAYLSQQKKFDFFARISAGRGCLHDCSFCTNRSVYGKTVRFRKEADVVEEMNDLNHRFSVKHFWFNDDLFVNGKPANTRWIGNFTGILLKNNLHYSYRILCRADSFTKNNLFLLDRMTESGLSHIYLGIESVSQDSLDVYNKKMTVQKNRSAVEQIKNRKIELILGFIMYNPYTSFKDIHENTMFLYSIGELFQIFPISSSLSVYPETPIARRLLKDGLLITNSCKEPLNCYRYQNDRIAYLSQKMDGYYNSTYPSERIINRIIKGPDKSDAVRISKLQYDLNILNRDKFLWLCNYIQNSAGIRDEMVRSFFDEWTAEKERILSDFETGTVDPS